MEDVDPLVLGVHRARPEKGRDVLPPYVLRDIDSEVQDTMRDAASDGGFILLTGDSAAGKSRTALHSMRKILSGYRVLSPAHGTDLRQLPELLDADSMRCALWLDDLEGHLGSHGLQANLLSELLRRKIVIVATIRHEQSERFRSHRARSLADHSDRRAQQDTYLGAQVLNIATTIEIPRKWSNDELSRVELYDDPRLLEALDHCDLHGVAEYVAAGPQLLQEWRQAMRVGGNPRGAALVAAAVDLSRAGLAGYFSQSLLEELHPIYLAAGGGPLLHPEPLADAIRWASTVRYGVTSLLLPGPDKSWRPFDYLADSAARDKVTQEIPEEIWHVALERATSSRDEYNIGASAFAADRVDIATSAWQAAADAGDVMAMVNLGALLMSQGRAAEGESWSQQSAEAGHAIGAFNLAVMLAERGEIAEAKHWYSLAVEAGFSDAAINLGNLYADEGRDDEAENLYLKAVSLGNPSGFFNLGFQSSDRGQYEQAEKYYRQAATAGHLMAANSLGLLLARQEKLDEAELCLRRAAESGLIAAQINLANMFAQQQRHDEAEPWYRKAHNAGEPHAALRLGDMFATVGQADAAEHWWKIAADAGVTEAADRQVTTVSISHDLTRTITNEKIRKRLGEAGLEDVYRNLWPRDCQTCGKSFGPAIPSLRINDMIVFGSASLHHPSCRAPEWSEHPTLAAEPLTSWQALAFVTEVLNNGKKQKIPILLVNPTLEQVFLKPASSGGWHTSTVEDFTQRGFTPLGLERGLPPNRTSVRSARIVPTAKMDKSDVAVTIWPGISEWSAPIDRAFFSIARSLGGLHIWVTTSLQPAEDLQLGLLAQEIADGNVAARWLFFDSSQNDSRNKSRSDRAYVLYWNEQHASVGEVIGHNLAAESGDQATSWANIELENNEVHLIPRLLHFWRESGDDCDRRGRDVTVTCGARVAW